jgi:hypothetical protein
MIINNQNLPYNLRISQNEPIVEIKETGQLVNLLRLTPDGAKSLANCLNNWAGCSIEGADELEEFARNNKPLVGTWGVAQDTDLVDPSLTADAAVNSSRPEPNPEEISSSPAKDEELI